MATKQGLYTGALTALGNRKVLITENVESRRVLDDVYDEVLQECLEESSWNFATETVQLDADTGIEPEFGYTEVFAKPTDFLKTAAISSDENFDFPLMRYTDEGDTISSDVTPIYLKYVSNDTGLGLDLTRWTQRFTRYVELELAARVAFRLTQSEKTEMKVQDMRDRARTRAKNLDSMDEPNPKFKPAGSWTTSRIGRSGFGDRGRRNSLTG